MSDEKKLDGELKEGAAAQGERELGVDAQAARRSARGAVARLVGG